MAGFPTITGASKDLTTDISFVETEMIRYWKRYSIVAVVVVTTVLAVWAQGPPL